MNRVDNDTLDKVLDAFQRGEDVATTTTTHKPGTRDYEQHRVDTINAELAKIETPGVRLWWSYGNRGAAFHADLLPDAR